MTRESTRKRRGFYDIKICKGCGAEWERGSDNIQRWTGLCLDCRKDNSFRTCIDCDDFLEKGSKAQRCEECKIIHRKQYKANWYENNKSNLNKQAELVE